MRPDREITRQTALDAFHRAHKQRSIIVGAKAETFIQQTPIAQQPHRQVLPGVSRLPLFAQRAKTVAGKAIKDTGKRDQQLREQVVTLGQRRNGPLKRRRRQHKAIAFANVVRQQ